MQPHKLTIHDVFERERRYDVPLYQRAYVWDEEEQWTPLWDDIRKQAERNLAEPEPKSTHFLGAVVWRNNPILGRSIAKADVIDGQQRLTTLQLFIVALRDIAQSIDPKLAAQAARWTKNPDLDGSDEEFKVWPTNADRQVFARVMRAGSAEAVRQLFRPNENGREVVALPRMAEAYLFFADAIADFVSEASTGDEKINRIHSIVQAMRTSLQFVVIELESDDDPQIIFETLNARGQPLLPSDLVRNYVFLNAARQNGQSSDTLYETYWRTFDNKRTAEPNKDGEDRFWHVQERQGRLTRPRIDLFLFHYLTLVTEQDLNIGELFKEFKKWHSTRNEPIERFLSELETFSKRFSNLIAPTGTDRLSVLARRLKALDTSTVYPLLLFLGSLPREKVSRDEIDAALVDLESFLVRRFVCNLTTKNYNRFFLGLLTKVKRAADAGTSVANTVREELLRSVENSAIWPTDTEFRRAWLSKPIYVRSRIDRAAMVLRALEEGLRTQRNEAVSLPADLTVEHLLPQKYSLSNYPYAKDMPRQQEESDEGCRKRMLDTIGNLTLLTRSLNASISNGPFPAKRLQISEDSDLRLNATFRNDERISWSETDVIARAEKLFDIASSIWPRPAVESKMVESESATRTFVEKIAAMIDAGIIADKAPLTLRHRGKSFDGILTRAGIKIEEGTFSPSIAATRCYARAGNDRQTENGWRAWRSDTGATLKELLASINDDAIEE